MSARLSAAQNAHVRRLASAGAAENTEGELNVVPFLDIVMNVVMFLLASITTVFTATLPLHSSSACVDCHAPTRAELTVKITAGGYIVASDDGFLQPDCVTFGRATLAVPNRLGQHDTSALTRCLDAARRGSSLRTQLATQREIQVATTGEIPYATFVQTLDAVRETRPGAHDLFPDPRIGLLN